MMLGLVLSTANCSDIVAANGGGSPAIEKPSTQHSRMADTIVTVPDSAVEILSLTQLGNGATITVLVPPLAGTIQRSDSVLRYVPSGQTAGTDLFVYRVDGPDPQPPRVVKLRVYRTLGTGNLRVLQQAVANPVDERRTYVAADPTDARIAALRPLVATILTDYGSPTGELDRARALRDWVARVAVHPHAPLHPSGSVANSAILPPGTAWSDANAIGLRKVNEDSRFWLQSWPDGVRMLERLLGTLDTATGQWADDGLLEHVAGSQYRIRDLESYRFVLCSYQSRMLIALWAAAGLHGMMTPTIGHDASAVFIPDLAKWVYMDPTFNEEYAFEGSDEPLSPVELFAYSAAQLVGQVTRRSVQGPSWSPDVYIDTKTDPLASYLGQHPDGYRIIGSQLQNSFERPMSHDRHVQLDVSTLDDDPTFSNELCLRASPPLWHSLSSVWKS